MGHRLLDGADGKGLQLPDAADRLGDRPGLVGVHAQVDLPAQPAADVPQAVDVVLAGDADLHLDLAEAVQPHLKGGRADLEGAGGRGDGPAVAYPVLWFVQLGGQQPGRRGQGSVNSTV